MTKKSVDNPASKLKESSEEGFLTADKGMDLGILLELGSIGAGNAATALSEVLQQPISIEVPKIYTLEPHRVPQFYKMHEKPITALYAQLNQESDCDLLLLFDIDEARKIVALMTMVSSADEVDPAMEKSAIEELANILFGSFLSAISNFTNIQLIPTPPQRVIDSFDAIIDNFLVKQALVSDEVIIFDVRFKRDKETASCILMVFPSKELQEALIGKARQWINSQIEVDEKSIILGKQ